MDEDDPVGEAHRYGSSEPSEYIDPESDLPDPIIARAKDMTRRAEAAEDDMDDPDLDAAMMEIDA